MTCTGRRIVLWMLPLIASLKDALERSLHPTWAIGTRGLLYRGRVLHSSVNWWTKWSTVLKADPCGYCGRPSDTIDHVVPLAKGGAPGLSNQAGACRRCNGLKRDTSLLHFLIARRHAFLHPPIVSAAARRNEQRRAAKRMAVAR